MGDVGRHGRCPVARRDRGALVVASKGVVGRKGGRGGCGHGHIGSLHDIGPFVVPRGNTAIFRPLFEDTKGTPEPVSVTSRFGKPKHHVNVPGN
jgi:hypothetical protein